jgi:ankyrin repeat protein
MLLAAGARVKVICGESPTTPLVRAATSPNPEHLRLLLAHTDDPDELWRPASAPGEVRFGNEDQRRSPLLQAILHGNCEGLKLLIDAGAEVNRVYGRRERYCALDLARRRRMATCEKILLDAGAKSYESR